MYVLTRTNMQQLIFQKKKKMQQFQKGITVLPLLFNKKLTFDYKEEDRRCKRGRTKQLLD